jgi:hypothetical protein
MLCVIEDLDNVIVHWGNLGFTQIIILDTVVAEFIKTGKTVKIRLAKANIGGSNITWIQPLGEESVFSGFHNSYGDGAMSLVHRMESKGALRGELNRLSGIGLDIKEEINILTNKGNLYYVLMDTWDEGKYYLGYTYGDEDLKMMQELSSENLHNMQINQYAFAIHNAESISE